MSKLNKLVTNYPVTLSPEEVENLSATLAPVVAACGGGGGGGTPIYYYGDDVNINISPARVIRLTDAATAKLNRDIPTKVSDLSDSANYQTVAGMDEYLTTANAKTLYQTKEDMSAYLTSANASSTYQTKDAMSAYWTSAETNAAFAEEISTLIGLIDGKQNKLTFAYDNDKISAIDGSALAGQGGVTGDYYSASNPSGFITSSVNELDNFYSKTDTSSKTELQTKFNSLLDCNVTAAAGIQVTTATDAGIKTFGISMTAEPVVTDTRLSGYNGVAASLDTNVSGLWNVGLTQDMLNTINGKIDTTAAAQTYQPKGDYLSANALTNYYTKSETSGASELSAEFANIWSNFDEYETKDDLNTVLENYVEYTQLDNYYQTTETSSKNELSTEFAKYQLTGDYATTAQLNTASSTLTGVDNLLSGHIDYVSGQVDNKLNVPLSSDVSIQDKYLVLRTNANGTVSAWCDFQDQSYSKTEALGTFVATANIDSTTLSGDGKSVSTKLGVKTDVIATIDYVSGNFLPTSGGTVSGQLVVSGGSNFDQENLKFIRTGQNGYGRIGLASDGALALKIDNGAGDTLQINMSTEGSTGYGNINVNNHGNQSKVVNVPTASYNSMSSFDNTNGPNYMLRKTASGFDIGAAVINVTTLPQNTEANAYYFVYDA